VLALLGGVAGVIAAQWGGGALRRVFLASSDGSGVVGDARTLVFALGATLAAALVAGLAPAFQDTTERTADSLKAGSREGAYTHSRARSLLLVLQAAVSVVLLVGAGLFVRSVREVRAIRLGYDVDPLLVVQANWRETNPSGDDEAARLRRMPLLRRVLDEARAASGVTNASYAVTVPFYSSEGRGLWVPGVDSVRKLGRFTLQIASPEYFATMGTRILRGRGIAADDGQNAPRVVVVSEAMAKVLWPGRDAIGQCISFTAEMVPCITVVGVAENIRGRSLTGSPEFHYYLPAEQFMTEPVIIVRVAGNGADHAEPVRRNLQRLMPSSAYVTVTPMTAIMAPRVRSWQYGATMFVAFGGLALALAAIGLYAVVAFAVAQRTHELGLRIALGAQMDDVLRLVIGEGIGFALAGVALGFGIALAAGSRLSPLLYGVSVRDPATYAAVAGLLIAVAAIASAVPAMRAARVDPNVALRTE
jgi:predicted permease